MPTVNSRSRPADNQKKSVLVTITYLELTNRPNLPSLPAPQAKTALLRAEEPPVHFYRYLYDLIGRPHNWVSRSSLSEADLLKIIHNPAVYIYVLYVNGAPAGFAEIDAQVDKLCQLKFFGLAPDYVGKGLSRFFLSNVIDLAWSLAPKTIRLETCSLDHPAALPLYQKFGFEVVDRRTASVQLPSK